MFVKHIIKTLHVSVTAVWPSSGGRSSCLVLLLLCLFASWSCLFGMWLYVVCNVMFALEWFHDFIYQDMKKMKHVTEKGMDLPMCVHAWCTCLWDVWLWTVSYSILYIILQATYSHIPNKQLDDANKQRSSNSTKHERRPPEDGQTIVTETCRVLTL